MGAADIANFYIRARDKGVLLGAPGAFATTGDVVETDDRSLITRIAGVPVGFQFATYMGMDGVPALALDILTDPITYLSVPHHAVLGPEDRERGCRGRGADRAW